MLRKLLSLLPFLKAPTVLFPKNVLAVYRLKSHQERSFWKWRSTKLVRIVHPWGDLLEHPVKLISFLPWIILWLPNSYSTMTTRLTSLLKRKLTRRWTPVLLKLLVQPPIHSKSRFWRKFFMPSSIMATGLISHTRNGIHLSQTTRNISKFALSSTWLPAMAKNIWSRIRDINNLASSSLDWFTTTPHQVEMFRELTPRSNASSPPSTSFG